MWKRYPTKVATIATDHGPVRVLTRACAGGPGLGPRFIVSVARRRGFRRMTFEMGEADVKDTAQGSGVNTMFPDAGFMLFRAHLQDEAKRWLKALRASRRKP